MNPSRSHPGVPWLLSAPAAALLAACFLAPLVLLVRISFYESAAGGDGFYRPGTWSIAAYTELLGESFGRHILWFTVLLGVAVAALALLIGYPLALFIHTLPRRAKIAALAIVILPKLSNVFIVLYGVGMLLGQHGPANRTLMALGLASEPLLLTHNLTGVLFAETYLILPYAIIVLVPALDRIDPALSAAARGLGAGRWVTFRRVVLPLTLPGIIVAGQLCLIWSLGAFVGPVLLGGPDQTTLSVLVHRQSLEYSDWPRAAATAVLSLVTIAVCAALYAIPARQRHRAGGPHDA